MSQAVAEIRRSTKTAQPARALKAAEEGYFTLSSLPLTSLLFLIPFIIVYEIGTNWYASDPVSHVEQRILAFKDLKNFFDWFGATGRYMPAAAVAGILLACHIARRDQWSARSGVLVGMFVESFMYAIPLVTLGYLFQHYLLFRPTSHNWRMLLILSIGAGIYEELVFRLILFHLLHMLFMDLLKVPKNRAIPLMVLISAVSFSLYHYQIPWLFCAGPSNSTGKALFFAPWREFISVRFLCGVVLV